jgi:hypothetical protein
MTRTPLILTLVAAAALAGCDNSQPTIVGGPVDDPSIDANAPVTLPPSIASSKIYRCSGDNSVVYVDWLSDEKTANVRVAEGGSPTQVTAAEPGQPLTGPSGLSLKGAAADSSISVTLPGQSAKTCRA